VNVYVLDLAFYCLLVSIPFAIFLMSAAERQTSEAITFGDTYNTAVAGFFLVFVVGIVGSVSGAYAFLYDTVFSAKAAVLNQVVVLVIDTLISFVLVALGTYFWVRKVHTDICPTDGSSLAWMIVFALIKTLIFVAIFSLFYLKFLPVLGKYIAQALAF